MNYDIILHNLYISLSIRNENIKIFKDQISYIIYNHKNIYIIKTKIIYYALFIQFNKFDIFYFYIYFTNANV